MGPTEEDGARLPLLPVPPAQPAELKQLLSFWNQQVVRFGQGGNAKEALGLVGELPWPESVPVWEEAAWALVANVLLNLDQTITKSERVTSVGDEGEKKHEITET